MSENNNLTIYAKMAEPPKTALKTIQAGRLRGMSDINPQWRYRIMTEVFGICGIGWKFNIDKTWLEQGGNGEVVANAQVSVYVRDPETKEWSDAIVGVGGSMLVTNEKSGIHTSDEAFKMAVTDAFSTSLKMLGVAAAIYEGRWDGSKYYKADYSEQTSTPKVEPVQLSPEAQKERDKAVKEITEKINKLSFLIPADGNERIQAEIKAGNLTYLNAVLKWCEEEKAKLDKGVA